MALLRPIKEPYICHTPVNMRGLHGKVSAHRTWGSGGGTIGTFHFSTQSKQSEDFLNQRRESVQWTTSLTETWRPAPAAGRANNLRDLVWRATPLHTARIKHVHAHITRALTHIEPFGESQLWWQAFAAFVTNFLTSYCTVSSQHIVYLTVKLLCAWFRCCITFKSEHLQTPTCERYLKNVECHSFLHICWVLPPVINPNQPTAAVPVL